MRLWRLCQLNKRCWQDRIFCVFRKTRIRPGLANFFISFKLPFISEETWRKKDRGVRESVREKEKEEVQEGGRKGGRERRREWGWGGIIKLLVSCIASYLIRDFSLFPICFVLSEQSYSNVIQFNSATLSRTRTFLHWSLYNSLARVVIWMSKTISFNTYARHLRLTFLLPSDIRPTLELMASLVAIG